MPTIAGHRLSRLDVGFLLAAVCMGALFTRLGVWQISRLQERRARNVLVLSRLDRPPRALVDLPRDTAAARFMPLRLVGTYDFDHELILVNRSRDGAPGVQFVTPLRPSSASDTAVLVDRGWAYAPDAETVDPMRWREPANVNATGYVAELPAIGSGAAALQGHPREVRWLDPVAIARMIGYPVAPFLVVLAGGTTAGGQQAAPTGPVSETPARDQQAAPTGPVSETPARGQQAAPTGPVWETPARGQQAAPTGPVWETPARDQQAAPTGPVSETPARDQQAAPAGFVPIRLGTPALDDGPHLNYAIQWFAFAALAFVGAPVVVLRSRAAAIPS